MRLGREKSMGVVEEREEEQRVADMTTAPGDGSTAPAPATAAPATAAPATTTPATTTAPAPVPVGERAAGDGLIRSR